MYVLLLLTNGHITSSGLIVSLAILLIFFITAGGGTNSILQARYT